MAPEKPFCRFSELLLPGDLPAVSGKEEVHLDPVDKGERKKSPPGQKHEGIGKLCRNEKNAVSQFLLLQEAFGRAIVAGNLVKGSDSPGGQAGGVVEKDDVSPVNDIDDRAGRETTLRKIILGDKGIGHGAGAGRPRIVVKCLAIRGVGRGLVSL